MEVIEKTAALAHLRLSSEEVNLYQAQLDAILEFVSQLSEVNTQNVDPMITATDMESTFNRDGTQKYMTVEEILGNSPERQGQLFRVPPVL